MSGSKLVSGTLRLMAAVVVVLSGAVIYVTVTHVEEDLERLAKPARMHSFAAMVKSVQARKVGPEGFRFVVLGDTRSDMETARMVLARAAAEEPAFILGTGDVVRHGTVDEYFDHHLPLVEAIAPIPYIPAPGNHEDGPNRDFAAFKALFGSERFSFDYGGCRFVGINTGDRLRMDWGDMAYLERELERPGVDHRFVVLHIPPIFIEAAGGRDFGWNAKGFRELMNRTGVNHVFMGHIHGYATETHDGVRYTISGGGGAPLTETLGEEGSVRNYVVVHVVSEGLRTEVVRLLGDEWVRSDIP